MERLPFNKKSPIPEKYAWPELLKRGVDELEIHYRHTLEQLDKEPGLIGAIFWRGTKPNRRRVDPDGFLEGNRTGDEEDMNLIFSTSSGGTLF